jgi:Sec-independent protein translocase protein TatA
LLVGYFVLGPSDLYKLVKEIGKAVQNFRTLSSEASKTLESTMESQLELDEIRKAQRELNDAFSFRRSINVDQDEEAFTTTTTSEKIGAEPIRGDIGSSKKKIRRRKKVVAEEVEVPAGDELNANIPDLDMTDAFSDFDKTFDMEAEAEKVRAERMERLQASNQPGNEWLGDQFDDDDDDDDNAADIEAARFQAQLNNWNESILANEDKLSPLSKIMERLALLEEEQARQVFRLEEEYRERAALEERFYRQKRALLEEAAAEIQAGAYMNPDESISA